jgi:hypothetical protein
MLSWCDPCSMGLFLLCYKKYAEPNTVKYLFKKYVTKTDEVLWYQCLQCYKDASLSAIKALLKELKWSAFNILVRFQILMVTSMKMTTQHYILEDCHLQYYNFVYFWLLWENTLSHWDLKLFLSLWHLVMPYDTISFGINSNPYESQFLLWCGPNKYCDSRPLNY